MNLFDSAGISLETSQRHRRGAPRVPLLAEKVLEAARAKFLLDPDSPARKAALAYAQKLKSPAFIGQNEQAVRPIFIDEILVKVLGYQRFLPDAAFTLRDEVSAAGGKVDTALGHFQSDGTSQVLAPFELKGPTTQDLDAIMPGRGKSPVQQAWDYANDLPGSRWVLVSNCVEIRLYGYGRGRMAYESFDLARLDDDEQFARLAMVLGAKNLLEGGTARLLLDSDAALKDITNELYADYKALRDRLIGFFTGEVDGPKLKALDAIEPAQKILDRVLFVAFAESTGLLPRDLLKDVKAQANQFSPPPWKNFLTLFDAVNRGNSRIKIPAYNGGLFAQDPKIDGVVLEDTLASDLAELGKWDYGSGVPVTVLGHIFEQSITDLEKLKAESSGQAPPKVGKRKRDGVVYTPEMITRFLVEQTLGKMLEARLEALKAKAGWVGDPNEAQERAVWPAYLATLRSLTLVDPACGSGAFLIAAYDVLLAEYSRVTQRLEALGLAQGFDFIDEIITKNLFGVDLNAESVEITKLSLWLKTARREHRLQNLDANIKTGNSLIDDADFTPHPFNSQWQPFNWQSQFPGVFAHGGFDLVLGNPPYVRQELIKAIKPYLRKEYTVFNNAADLYTYFFERGIKLLKPGGRLGFISSSTFFRTGSGENLRKFLSDGVALETIVDFGDLQIFEGVTTYPAIVTLRRDDAASGTADDSDIFYYKLKNLIPEDLSRDFKAQALTMPRERLGSGAWRLEDDALNQLRTKITHGRKTLGEVYGAPLYGIKTGLNEAFVIDTATRDRLIARDPKSAELLKPFLRGENVKRWRVEPEGLWLIDVTSGLTRKLADGSLHPSLDPDEELDEGTAWSVFSEEYRAIADHLAIFEDDARKRTDQGHYWWELRACAYKAKFAGDKILFPDMSQGPKFSIDTSYALCANTSYFIPNASSDLLCLLNCKITWWYLLGETAALRGGNWRLRMFTQNVETIPIPEIPADARLRLSALAQTCTGAAKARLQIQTSARASIMTLATGNKTKPSTRLQAFWTLDFKAFLIEIKKSFGTELPLKKHADWQDFLNESSATIKAHTAAIAAAEREIDTLVYGLFDLTEEEIKLLEASLQA